MDVQRDDEIGRAVAAFNHMAEKLQETTERLVYLRQLESWQLLARKTAHEVWALSALGGPLFTEIKTPAHFEAAFKPITEKQVAEAVVCGPDPKRHVDAIRKADRAGYTHVCVHQIGSDQEGFFDVYEREVLPRFRTRDSARRPSQAVGEPAAREARRKRA